MINPDQSSLKFTGKPAKTEQVVLEDIVAELKQTKEALKIAEENYSSLVEKSADGIVILVSHTIEYVNHKMYKISGYSKDEITGKQFLEIVAPEYHDLLKRNYEMKLVSGEPNALEMEIIAQDGRKISVETRALRIMFKARVATMVVIRDITKRKRAEDALKASEQNFRNSLESSSLGIRIANLQGETLYANQALLDIFSYRDFNEVKSSPPQEHFTPGSYAGFVDRKEKKSRNEQIPDKVDIDIVRKDGSLRHLQVFPRDILWNGEKGLEIYYDDITERKQAEAARQLSEQNFRNSLDSSFMGIRISDNNDNTSYVNQAFLDIFGYNNIDEVKVSPPPQHYTPAAFADWLLRHEKLLRGEPMPKQIDVDIIRKDGAIRHLDVSMREVFWNGKLQNQTLYNDVTERREMAEKLLASDRLASIGQMSTGIAHELNNPLTSILGFSNMILEKDVPGDLKEELQIISTEAARANRIVKGLLTFVRKDDSQKRPLKINRVIESVLESRADEQKANNIRVHLQLDPDLPEIIADQFQMHQVFVNIVINAEYFMTEAHKQGNLTVSSQKVGDIVKIVFTDDGPGITPENLKHVFDPFYTTKEVGKGTGLGLSICHGIVTSHGGRIYAESKPGEGSSFIVELPCVTVVESDGLLSR